MNAPTPAHPSPIRNSYWVLPGKVLAGEHPNAATVEATRERLQRLLDAGVECFIDLTEPGEVKPYDSEIPFSIEYLRKPIRDHGIPAQRGHMAEILDCIHDALQSGRCVYVHCRAGIGRTGTVVGCLLVERGFDGESAIDELNRLWQQCERSENWPSIPETDDQAAYVRKWKARAVFAEELSLASSAARDALAGKSGSPSSGTSPGSTAGAGAIPGLSPGVLGGTAAGVGLPHGGPAPGVAPSSAANSASGAKSTAPDLAGLGLPLLDDDDNEPSDFATFNEARGIPASSASGGGSAPLPAQVVQPDAWPALGKQPAAGARGTSTAGRGAPRTGPGNTAPDRGSPHDSSTADSAARRSARDPTTGARDPAAATRDPSTATRRGPAQDSAAPNPARDARAPTLATPNTTSDDPLSDPEILSAARSLRERFLGALLGLAAGDAVAAATQFRKPGTFTPVGDMIGGGPYDLPRGGWSDDTAMALCLADSLLERNGFDARDQMDRYRKWQQEGYLSSTGQSVGITASTARAIAMSAWRRGALFGSHDPAQLDPEPLSRVAPAVMFFFAASGQAVDQATEAARTTCQAPAVLDACRSLARAMHAALSGQPKAAVLEKAVQAIGTAPGRTPTGISAPAALTAAVAAFGATANFRDAVLYAANLGGDSDVICAVCGQLAGAYYSVKAIPTSWHNGLMQKDLIISYADRLLAHAMIGLSG